MSHFKALYRSTQRPWWGWGCVNGSSSVVVGDETDGEAGARLVF